ncbi:MAG: hypothetical protein HND57_05385 [Planctomycetes bacterium]|nr:hypothetical protein [Planctomycetota bacterium]
MAGKAGVKRDDQVLALDDLRVTGHTPELLSTSEFAEVRLVIEVDRDFIAALRRDIPLYETLKQAVAVTALSQTGLVPNFGVRLRAIGVGDVLDGLARGFELAFDRVLPAGLKVAVTAGDGVVGRFMPRHVIRLHDVAPTAEAGGHRVLGKSDADPDEENKAPQEHAPGCDGEEDEPSLARTEPEQACCDRRLMRRLTFRHR